MLCVCVWAHACACVFVCVRARACVCACVCIYMCVPLRLYVSTFLNGSSPNLERKFLWVVTRIVGYFGLLVHTTLTRLSLEGLYSNLLGTCYKSPGGHLVSKWVPMWENVFLNETLFELWQGLKLVPFSSSDCSKCPPFYVIFVNIFGNVPFSRLILKKAPPFRHSIP
jgi:hypothetical protein